ncbi:MAG: pyridoxal-phosphate dependent enzyme [Spirochaetales bacterium]|nr:pyridoxal-phosphate dependent enzyme [Spirochaetales bacterium]
MINRIKNREVLEKTARHFREKNIILPRFSEMKNPEEIHPAIKKKLKTVGLWDLDPLNLFRITWKNEPVSSGGGFGGVNYIELPSVLTGIDARIIVLIGKWFPTGAHKVGAAYGCLAPRLVTGDFDPTVHKAVWPSTGNYCRGGAFDSWLMDCTAIAILPEEMSRERFSWLKDIGAEVIATPGCESNVKEIYDKCDELRATRNDVFIFNQFDEFGNAAWHYQVSGAALEEVYEKVKKAGSNPSAFVSATGSAGTIAAGDYLKKVYPGLKIVASEALQCPTLMLNGFGGHRIEGIGDKHVPWIHNTRSTDLVAAIDDTHCMDILRLFNEPAGLQFLNGTGCDIADLLPLIGISGIANILSAIKTAKYFEMGSNDVILTVATDSADMYRSRIDELRTQFGEFDDRKAEIIFRADILGQSTDHLKELCYYDRKAIHNLKYYTWIEQQGKELEDLNRLWSDEKIWEQLFAQPLVWDNMIDEFNEMTGLKKEL